MIWPCWMVFNRDLSCFSELNHQIVFLAPLGGLQSTLIYCKLHC